MMVIDFHTHAFPDELAKKALDNLHQTSGDYQAYHDGTISGLLRSMDRAGIERAVIASIATKPEQVPNITQWSIRIQSRRIIPFASIHPRFENVAEELKKIKEAGLRGIKLHPMYQEFSIDERELFPLYEAISENDLILLFHAGWDIAFPTNLQATPDKILTVHRAFPELKIVASHLGGWQTWDDVEKNLAGRTIYFETSFAIRQAEPSIFRRILSTHSPDYFLFGSDSPWLDQEKELNEWKNLDIPDSFLEKILYRNAERLLNL